MKKYVCDSCKKVIDDPFKVRMKEFYYTPEYDLGMAFPVETKTRRKIHLCETCFRALKYIAQNSAG